MHKKALICGFVGRENFGDELMLHLHTTLLKDLGYSVYHTTDAVHFKYLKKDYCFANKLIEPFDMSFDLILYGGGALPLNFLSELLIRYRITRPATKIIASCINVFNEKNISDLTVSFYNNIFDCIIFRERISQELADKLKIKNYFLPDIVTTLTPQCSTQDKTAVIIRENVFLKLSEQIVLPKEEFDILVMSSSDDVSDERLSQPNTKRIYNKHPLDQYHELTSYKRILSMGRFHAALCGKNRQNDTCYLYPFITDSSTLKTNEKYLSWEQLKYFEHEQMQQDSDNNLCCKTGTLIREFYDYPDSTIQEYKNIIQECLE